MYTAEEQATNNVILELINKLKESLHHLSPDQVQKDAEIRQAIDLSDALLRQDHLPRVDQLENNLQAIACGQIFKPAQALRLLSHQASGIHAHIHKGYTFDHVIRAMQKRCAELDYGFMFKSTDSLYKNPLLPLLLAKLVTETFGPMQEIVGRVHMSEQALYECNFTFQYPWLPHFITSIENAYFSAFKVCPSRIIRDTAETDRCCIVFSCNTLVQDFIPSVTARDLQQIVDNACYARLIGKKESGLINGSRSTEDDDNLESISQTHVVARRKCLPLSLIHI